MTDMTSKAVTAHVEALKATLDYLFAKRAAIHPEVLHELDVALNTIKVAAEKYLSK